MNESSSVVHHSMQLRRHDVIGQARARHEPSDGNNQKRRATAIPAKQHVTPLEPLCGLKTSVWRRLSLLGVTSHGRTLTDNREG